MARALRVRRLKEAYRLLPLLSVGNRCNLLVKDSILLPPFLNFKKNLHADINTRCGYRYRQDHRYSTISEVVSEPLVQFNFPSFVKSTIDKPEEPTIEEGTMSRGEEIPEGKVEINCSVNSSPGTSEVIICAALYLRLKKDSDACSDSRQRKAARIVDLLNPGTRVGRDSILQFLLASNRDLEEVIITRPLHVRLKFDCPKHPKADNSKDIILTDTSLNVNVSLN